MGRNRELIAEHYKVKEKAMEAINEACVIACECMQSYVPKKVKNIYKSECEDDIEYFGERAFFGYCPVCGEIQNIVWNIEYCGNCGQKLDWI